MGHREDLLEGAKACLLEKGWARTTARDIVAASGANLASIGYHYGGKDELMRAAFLALIDDWGVRVAAEVRGDTDRAKVWDAMIKGVDANRGFWLAQLEVLGQLEHNSKLKDFFVEVMPQGWEGMVTLFEGVPEDQVDKARAGTDGWLYSALFVGIWTQHLISPDATPSGAQIEASLRRMAGG
ncbi:TetR/AcrR family transcriptional regulator [Streptomyces sp. A7024]|uniref:TetR/AcrR family transcriptional regulator n=1 Tax=Streptomyces coryli TaxID=1128680 RepID=A0A6G4U1W3_9ACTN|nr:TetR/AcrR family transcriptional regulator [Streptomyces coryli]NGN66073.1 TetR/AcrR family transcriptional regulator [Streptomyces coryli]